jgi:hypothetical protein
MVQSILKILAALFDIPKYWDRVRAFFLKRKVRKLELAIEKKDATLAVEAIQKTEAKKTEDRREKIKHEVKTDTLGDVSEYFGTD